MVRLGDYLGRPNYILDEQTFHNDPTTQSVSSPKTPIVGSLRRKHPFTNQAELQLDAHPQRITLNPIHIASFFTA
jgi:hypothetical protein